MDILPQDEKKIKQKRILVKITAVAAGFITAGLSSSGKSGHGKKKGGLSAANPGILYSRFSSPSFWAEASESSPAALGLSTGLGDGVSSAVFLTSIMRICEAV